MKSIAIIIPAHNEQTVIRHTLISTIKIVGADNVYVVDDFSTDNTATIAQKFTKNVYTLPKNAGKANALNAAIVKFKLTKRYRYIMPIDADTILAPDFFDHCLPIFEKDSRNKVACVVGKIAGRNKKWITSYRLWEYEVNQVLHKRAQALIGAITVCPGPSTVYRARVFKKLRYSSRTQTEDMDLTFRIHRKKLGKIAFQPRSIVSTQDPGDLKSLFKQLKRWYRGFWQCISKNNIPWGGQMLDVESALLAVDGLLNSILAAFYLFVIPFSLFVKPNFMLIPILADLFLFMLPTILYVSYKRHIYTLIRYLPHFYILRFLSSFIFLYSFIQSTFSELSIEGWDTKRYLFRKGEVWAS